MVHMMFKGVASPNKQTSWCHIPSQKLEDFGILELITCNLVITLGKNSIPSEMFKFSLFSSQFHPFSSFSFSLWILFLSFLSLFPSQFFLPFQIFSVWGAVCPLSTTGYAPGDICKGTLNINPQRGTSVWQIGHMWSVDRFYLQLENPHWGHFL